MEDKFKIDGGPQKSQNVHWFGDRMRGAPKVFTAPFLDIQFAKTIGCTSYNGAEVGECYETASRIIDGDVESYSVAFLATAERVEAIARHSKDGGHRVSAREAFLRACTYWRTGSNFLSHADPRHRSAMQRQIDCFVEAGRLFDHPFEDLSIPIDNEQTVPAYFLKPDHTDTQRPTLICIGGGDTTAEEVYFWGDGAAAVRRGYNALLLEFPGQRGAYFRDNRSILRPDVEVPTRYVVDYLIGRGDVDPERIAIIGHSQGGYFAPRAAAGEKRISACIANPIVPDQLFGFMGALGLAPDPEASHEDLVASLQEGMANKVNSPLISKMFEDDVYARFGVEGGTVFDFLNSTVDFTLWGLEGEIKCPVLNMCPVAEGEVAHRKSRQFFDKLSCDKVERVVTQNEGAELHCSVNGPSVKHQIEFDWLDDVFRKS